MKYEQFGGRANGLAQTWDIPCPTLMRRYAPKGVQIAVPASFSRSFRLQDQLQLPAVIGGIDKGHGVVAAEAGVAETAAGHRPLQPFEAQVA